VTVDAQPGVIREVGAELDENGPKSAVVFTIHGQAAPSALRRFSVRNSEVFSCARPMNNTPSSPVNAAR
jgi:hypothetical protein